MSDELLIVLSRRETVAGCTFRAYLAELGVADGRAALTNALVALGHIVRDDDRYAIAPRMLARLPGTPRAVLCGHRTVETAELLRAACLRHGANLTVTPSSETKLVPDRRLVEADDDTLAIIADEVEALFMPQPAAWRVLNHAASLDEVLSQCRFQRVADHRWARKDFDTRTLWTRDTPQPAGQRDGLAGFQDPLTHAWTWMLRRGEAAAAIDRDWGRWAALRDADRDVLRVGGVEVAVPLGALLPDPVAAGLALCSGLPPRRVAIDDVAHLVYAEVPRLLSTLVANKLAQTPIPLEAAPCS